MLLPALQATRISLTDALRGQLTHALRSGALRNLLVTGQVAVSLVILIVAATLLRNGSAIRGTDLGMDIAGVVVVRGGTKNELIRRVHDELRVDPRVAEIAVASRSPLFGTAPGAALPGPSGVVLASYTFASPEYFSLLRIPIVHGRSFSAGEAAAESPVAIVSAAGARVVAGRATARQDGADPDRTAGTANRRRHHQGDARRPEK